MDFSNVKYPWLGWLTLADWLTKWYNTDVIIKPQLSTSYDKQYNENK